MGQESSFRLGCARRGTPAPFLLCSLCGGRGVSAKKAKGKSKRAAKPAAAKESKATAKKSLDVAEVRESINELGKESAKEIATSVIEVATRTGQLASAKYLFEAVGIYPPTEIEERPIETTMAHQLLTRMGIPLEPVVQDEDEDENREVVTTKVEQPSPDKVADEDSTEGEDKPHLVTGDE